MLLHGPVHDPGRGGLTAERIDTKATVSLEQSEGGFDITAVHLDVSANVPDTDQQAFAQAAEKAKAGCPVSKVLNADITMDAHLEQ